MDKHDISTLMDKHDISTELQVWKSMLMKFFLLTVLQ
jgi:hypothetical protein